jgi:hypothetical protein
LDQDKVVMAEDLVTIYTAASPQEAEFLRQILAESDIPSWLINETSSQVLLKEAWMLSARVVVAREDAVEARAIALRLDAHLAARRSLPAKPEPDVSTMILDDADSFWPRCPVCGVRRLAVCRICETSGRDFPLAFAPPPLPDDDNAHRPQKMVVCPTCDEPFHPRYFRLCEHCGHEFPDGVAVSQPQAPVADDTFNRQRMALLLVGVILLGAALTLYFWYIVPPAR